LFGIAHWHGHRDYTQSFPLPWDSSANPIQVLRIPPETGARLKTKPHPYRRCPCGKLWWGKDAQFSEQFCAGDGDPVDVEGISTSSAPLFGVPGVTG
jgi:hypothetical protein